MREATFGPWLLCCAKRVLPTHLRQLAQRALLQLAARVHGQVQLASVWSCVFASLWLFFLVLFALLVLLSHVVLIWLARAVQRCDGPFWPCHLSPATRIACELLSVCVCAPRAVCIGFPLSALFSLVPRRVFCELAC